MSDLVWGEEGVRCLRVEETPLRGRHKRDGEWLEASGRRGSLTNGKTAKGQ